MGAVRATPPRGDRPDLVILPVQQRAKCERAVLIATLIGPFLGGQRAVEIVMLRQPAPHGVNACRASELVSPPISKMSSVEFAAVAPYVREEIGPARIAAIGSPAAAASAPVRSPRRRNTAPSILAPEP